MEQSQSLILNATATVDMVEFAPVRVILSGKTSTEKKLNVINSGTAATALYFANAKGKVGQVARQSVSMLGASKMVREVRSGNYRSVAEALAVLLGQSIIISNRAAWESLGDRFEGMIADLKDGGYKGEKPTAKRVALDKALELVANVNESVAAMIQQERAERAAEQPQA